MKVNPPSNVNRNAKSPCRVMLGDELPLALGRMRAQELDLPGIHLFNVDRVTEHDPLLILRVVARNLDRTGIGITGSREGKQAVLHPGGELFIPVSPHFVGVVDLVAHPARDIAAMRKAVAEWD
jgi:hypothetical protein